MPASCLFCDVTPVRVNCDGHLFVFSVCSFIDPGSSLTTRRKSRVCVPSEASIWAGSERAVHQRLVWNLVSLSLFVLLVMNFHASTLFCVDTHIELAQDEMFPSVTCPILRRGRRPVTCLYMTTKRALANKVYESAAEAIHDIKDGKHVKNINYTSPQNWTEVRKKKCNRKAWSADFLEEREGGWKRMGTKRLKRLDNFRRNR